LPPDQPAAPGPRWAVRDVVRALSLYALTSIPVVAGGAFGQAFLRGGEGDLLARLASHNGEWYASIVEGGYRYRAHDKSNVAFFPLYPLAARAVQAATGLRTDAALLATSHLALAAAFVLLDRYLKLRWGAEKVGAAADQSAVARASSPWRPAWAGCPCDAHSAALVAFGLLPTTVFFRTGYSESTFVLLSILALYGMERRWPLAGITLLVGLATAARPAGVALVLPWAFCIVQRSTSPWIGAARLALLAPLACWGLLAFTAFLYAHCGDPLAFVDALLQWGARPPTAALDKAVGLLTAEPIWSAYVPSSPVYWKKFDDASPWLWSLPFANPLWFAATAALVLLGEWRRWLTAYETLLAAAALLLPYVLRSYEMGMIGHGRFAAVVFPVYLVLGRCLARLPPAIASSLLAIGGFFLGAYAALFATGHAFA
jgi:hypothetical protein